MFTIILEEREFPSDRVLNIRTEEFDPEVTEIRDSGGDVISRSVEPYRLLVRPFITEFDVHILPGPIPRGPEPTGEINFYACLFTAWYGGWTRSLDQLFFAPFPSHFVVYYVDTRSGFNANTVHTHAVSLYSLRVLEVSPVARFPDGIVSTADGQQLVEAEATLRGASLSEGIGGTYFVEWTAWTNPAAIINPPRVYGGGLTTVERRMTVEHNAVGRAVAFYKPFPEPPAREPAAEQEPRIGLPFEEMIHQVVERGDLTAVQKALQDIDERLEKLRRLQKLLKKRLEQSKQ